MFRLRDLKNGLLQIHKSNGPAFEGTVKTVLTEAIKLGVDPYELDIAVNEMRRNAHDYADFTVSGKFMYSRRNKWG